MPRFTSSFFVSLLTHVTLFGVLFFSYKYIYTPESQAEEEVVCVKLCCVVESEAPKPKPVPKKLIEKVEIKKSVPLQETPKIEQKPLVKEPLPIVEEQVQEEVASSTAVDKSEPLPQAKSQQEQQKSPQELYVDENLQKIIQLLQENLYYPRRARKSGIVGKVIVKFDLSTTAEVSGVEVLSSKSDILSRAAMETIESLSGKFPFPRENLTLNIPITYNLK